MTSVTPDGTKAQLLDPETWAQESFELAETFAYAEPIRTDKQGIELTRAYETSARDVARKQAAPVVFVVSAEASYITGANLTVDGGTNA